MTSIQRGAYQLYRVVIALIALACMVQFFLAGRGAFGIVPGSKIDDQSSFDPHRVLGEIIGFAAILAFLCAVVAWRDRGLIGKTFALAVMAEVLQHLFALPHHPWVSGLHAVDGVAILGFSAMLAHEAWRGRGRAPSVADA